MDDPAKRHYDVVIVGAGLAGLTLARHLLLRTDKTILLLEKRDQVPPRRQKVGESTVQLGAYYFSKVLQLEEHLLHEHLMKYNLRFYWKTQGRSNQSLEDYGQAYLRSFSNIPCYQIDRNKLEAELLKLNCANPRLTFHSGALDLQVELKPDEPHSIRYRRGGQEASILAGWIVDTSGRGRFLARSTSLLSANPIRHGSSFCWVDGLLDIETLTGFSPRAVRLKSDRAVLGHTPLWLATNHFMGEGYWFWVIPLRGRTSLGLVYDNRLIDQAQVWPPDRLLRWLNREQPLFSRALPARQIVDQGSFRDFSYDCAQTISEDRWAISGEAGRFTDPLYSPGSDLISLHNTLIAEAITAPPAELALRCRLYEQLMKAFYQATVPSYATSYDALGDQECFVMKYVWELTVYFGMYVFPFINDLFSDRRFIATYVRRFSRLGVINHSLQQFISAYYQWKKKTHPATARKPVFFELSEFAPLRSAEKTFYSLTTSLDDARQVLDAQLENLNLLARYIVAHIYSVVASDSQASVNRTLIDSIDFATLRFDVETIRESCAMHSHSFEAFQWMFDPAILDRFHSGRGLGENAVDESLAALSRT
jgi:2-polyprenyl-6-methoxyphenol hydroxylase-like FAD-dependent oxidoreductase